MPAALRSTGASLAYLLVKGALHQTEVGDHVVGCRLPGRLRTAMTRPTLVNGPVDSRRNVRAGDPGTAHS